MTADREFLFTPCAFTTDKEVEKLQNDYDNNEGDKADAALGRLNAIGNVLNDQRAPIRDLLNDQFIQVIDEIFCRLLIDCTPTLGTEDQKYFDQYSQYTVEVIEAMKTYA